MSKKAAVEQRVTTLSGFAPMLSSPFHTSQQRAWKMTAFGLCLIGFADIATPPDAWFGPAYLMIIGFAAWSLGWREAFGVALTSLAVTVFANGLSFYPFGTAAALWNLTMRFVAVSLIICMLDGARRSCEREWRLARTDPLTGALNRQAFFELTGNITHSNDWCILAYADLDGLKKLNDKQGHKQGDESLQAYAHCVKKITRKDDVFARIGGDEFILYMVVRDEDAGKAVATRLHQSMNAAMADFSADLRCSIGVLILAPGDRSIDRELSAADELMYEAKGHGAALVVATARETGGSLYISRDWRLTGSFESDKSALPEPETVRKWPLPRKTAA